MQAYTPKRSALEADHHITFEEVSKQVHYLRDVILWDIERGFEFQCQFHDSDAASFANHVMFSKLWFIRISSVNKKRFCLLLLEDDIPNAWTLSLLLKSIWNCRPKDAVASHAVATVWSSYDQSPLDHNRTAVPLQLLVDVMESDRKFFRSLEPSRKAEYMCELLKVAGGTVVWAVYEKARTIFENYRDEQLENLQDSVAVIEKQEGPVKPTQPMDDKGKKNPPGKVTVSGGGDVGSNYTPAKDPERELELCLSQWSSIIKSLKDSQKLEEVELSFNDGTKKRIWKINRPKPEVTETVGFIQLLPHTVAKRILNFIPRAQLADCARVNRYWAFLVDELKAELAARLKIDMEIERLMELVHRYDAVNQSMETFKTMTTTSYTVLVTRPQRHAGLNCSKQTSQKSGATNIFKSVMRETRIKLPPIRNLAELQDRLDNRGATDQRLRDWCKTVLGQYKDEVKGSANLPPITKRNSSGDGIMDFGNVIFPSTLMKQRLTLPLRPPLFKDPTTITTYKKNKTSNINASKVSITKLIKKGYNRYNLWSRDFSSLYTASKIASYKFPV